MSTILLQNWRNWPNVLRIVIYVLKVFTKYWLAIRENFIYTQDNNSMLTITLRLYLQKDHFKIYILV